MKKTYVTFGQVHKMTVNGHYFDKDCVAVINCNSASEGRRLAFQYFDNKFCFEYFEKEWNPDNLKYFPRGSIEVN